MKILAFIIFLVCFLQLKVHAEIVKNECRAVRIISNPPSIDGVLNENEWGDGEWISGFTQRSPYDGKAPSFKTEFKILYDDKNIYFAFRNHDPEPSKIERRMSRRDGFEGDWVEVNIDSYNDKRTAFSFTVTAAGVKGDEFISRDGDRWDGSWDPIWYSKTSINDEGWIAEMRIPLSQLRFANKDVQLWGLQVQRRIFRLEERAVWQYIPQNTPGWVSNFGDLKGIEGIKPQKQIEISPYILGKVETYQKDLDNPFAKTGNTKDFYGGVDGKIGITSDLTLDFTINPDFGQVEADPSEVNLSGFETYFSEKRPFFIEGRDILSFQITGGGSPISSDNLFYSRRIGRVPHHYPDLEDDEYVSLPASTNILGAAKLTGKTKNGLSIGIVESVTGEEFAKIESTEGEKREVLVEPFTNYFAGTLKKDINKGNTTIGGMVTATNRNLKEEHLSYLHSDAYSGGIDFLHQWKDKKYYFRTNTVISHIIGSEEAILETQTSHLHYFQRSDAEHLKVDSSAKSLTGHGGLISFGKQGGGHWQYAAWLTWRSPGLDLNDVGYTRRTDEFMQVSWAQYRVWEPKGIFRNYNINFNQWKGFNFDMHSLYEGGNINFHADFKNYWSIGAGFNFEGNQYSYSELRGGPMLRQDNYCGAFYNLFTDHRKKVRFGAGGSNNYGFDNAWESQNYWTTLIFRLSNAFSISSNPWINLSKSKLRYVETLENVDGKNEYICASLNQKTLGMSLRLNYNVTPDFTIQYYGQPFVSSVDYFDYKKITDPKSKKIDGRFYQFAENEIRYNWDKNIYEVDIDGDGQNESFNDPDFNFLQFRSNLVLRWEYIPGSTFYLVWSQGRTGFPSVQEFEFKTDYPEVFDIQPNNIFLLKLTYCIKS